MPRNPDVCPECGRDYSVVVAEALRENPDARRAELTIHCACGVALHNGTVSDRRRVEMHSRFYRAVDNARMEHYRSGDAAGDVLREPWDWSERIHLLADRLIGTMGVEEMRGVAAEIAALALAMWCVGEPVSGQPIGAPRRVSRSGRLTEVVAEPEPARFEPVRELLRQIRDEAVAQATGAASPAGDVEFFRSDVESPRRRGAPDLQVGPDLAEWLSRQEVMRQHARGVTVHPLPAIPRGDFVRASTGAIYGHPDTVAQLHRDAEAIDNIARAVLDNMEEEARPAFVRGHLPPE
jgi:hypothetical protein